MAFGLGRTTKATDESKSVAFLQVKLPAGEVRDGLPLVQHYGFASALPVGTDTVLVFMHGDRSNGVAVASNNQTLRPKGMSAGEVTIYDAWGHTIVLSQSGIAITGNVTVTGTITATGDITGAGISLDHHTHPDPQGGNTGAPQG